MTAGHGAHVRLGRGCFVVDALALPAGVNDRPGVTLLVARQQPLRLDVEDGTPFAGAAVLFAPGVRRRFVAAQPHLSITIEPGHGTYGAYLAWARQHRLGGFGADTAPQVQPQQLQALDRVASVADLDRWLTDLLAQHGRAVDAHPNEPLHFLRQAIAAEEAAAEVATADAVWRRFRHGYAWSAERRSRWLQAEIGVSLRELLLWRKLRRALVLLADDNHATRIAHDAGFADSAHLSRICLRTFGLRPRDAANRKIVQVVPLPDS